MTRSVSWVMTTDVGEIDLGAGIAVETLQRPSRGW
jgi:hypothetical protein